MADTREQIMTEARELFVQHGLAGVSMRTIADRVGVSATALYRHFDDKDALLASLLSRAFGVFGSYLGRCLSGRTPLERFRMSGVAYVEFALDHPHDYELMFLTNCEDLGYKKIFAEVEQRAAPTFDIVVERVRECIQAGVFVSGDPRPGALFAWSTLHGLVSLRLLGQLKKSLDEGAFRAQCEATLDWIELALSAKRAAKRK